MVKKVSKKNKKGVKPLKEEEKLEESNLKCGTIKEEESNNLDFNKFTKAIDKELISQNKIISSLKTENAHTAKEDNSNESQYKGLKNNYIKNSFNINIISMVTQLINTSENLPNDLKNKYPLNIILLDIVKELMLSDLEIVYFSLYLDIFGWDNDKYDVKDNLIIIGLLVKQYLNPDISIIEYFHIFQLYDFQ